MSQRRSLYVPNDDGTAVLADYYDGTYGKTLRIDVQSLESLATLLEFIADLCTGKVREILLKSLQRAVLVPPLLDVRLSVSGTESITAVKSEHGIVIEWNSPRNGWEEVVELMRPLLQQGLENTGRHQYLTPPGTNILVEVAFRE